MASPLAKFEKKSSCHAQQHLSCAEFGLWEQYRKLSFTSGQMFESAENTALRFSDESRCSIQRLRSRLVQKGWLIVLKEGKRTKNGQMSPTVFRAIDHEEWVKNQKKANQETNCKTNNSPRSEMSTEADSPRSEMSTTALTFEQEPRSKMSSRFEDNQSEIKAGLKIPPSPPADKILLPDAEKNAKHVKQSATLKNEHGKEIPRSEMSTVQALPELTGPEMFEQLPKERQWALYRRYNGNYGRAEIKVEFDAWRAECEWRAEQEQAVQRTAEGKM